MSVMLSRIDFDPQKLADEEEAELDREDAQQQRELKAFLDNELDDDFLDDASFTLHQSYDVQTRENKPATNGERPSYTPQETSKRVLTQNVDHQDIEGNSYDELAVYSDNAYANGDVFLNEPTDYPGLSRNHPNYSDYNDETNFPFQTQTRSHYASESRPSPADDPAKKKTAENAQLQILYTARGRKIEELQKEMEEKEEEMAKNNRILQHRLTMMTSEKDGLQTSNDQLQSLLLQHKKDVTLLQKQIEDEQNQNRQLNNELREISEKLYLSDGTIDSLQQQIKQLNQSESIARARAQHESMLANLRQKHEEEILLLKEKLDDLQQALAWKTEDVNRYREMLDSNSMANEVGMLRHRLETEEHTSGQLREDLKHQKQKNCGLDEQLKTLMMLVKPDDTQYASTPMNGGIDKKGREKLDFKTPLSRFHAAQNNVETPSSGEAAIRNELVKAFSVNREKEKLIGELKNEIDALKQHSDGGNNINVTNVSKTEGSCDNCRMLQSELDDRIAEIRYLNEKHNKSLRELQNESAEVKSNMTDLIKNFDKEKTMLSEKQQSAMLHLLDDAKEKVKIELTERYEAEKSQLLQQIEELNGDLLYTKGEYVKLGDDIKNMEELLRKEISENKQTELSNLKEKLEYEHVEQLQKKENQLVDKYLQDLENEKLKWQRECKELHCRDVEQQVTLAKIDWLHENEDKKTGEIKGAVKLAKAEWVKENAQSSNAQHIKIKQVETEWSKKIQVLKLEQEESERELQDMKRALQNAKAELDDNQKQWEQCRIELEQKIKTLQTQKKSSSKDVNRSMSSVIFDDIMKKDSNGNICNKCECKSSETKWRKKEATWKLREEELSRLVEEAREKLRCALGSSDVFDDAVQRNNEILSPMAENRLNYLLTTKEKLWKIKETAFKREIESIKDESDKFESQCRGLEKRNQELQRNFDKCEAEQVGAQNFYQQQISDLKDDVSKLNEALNKERNQVSDQNLKMQTLEQEKERKRMEDNEKLEQLILSEKKKWQAQSAKLQEEALKTECERLRNNLLAEIHNQNDGELTNQINMLKQQHEIEVRQLKQSFRSKLERINEMKKRLLEEEKIKRENIEKNLIKKHENYLVELQRQHEVLSKEQQEVWKTNMTHAQEEYMDTIRSLREELKQMENNFGERERKCEEEMLIRTQEIDGLKLNHQRELRELKRDYERRKTSVGKTTSAAQSPSQDVELIEKIRHFYLSTLKQINSDVMSHVTASRERAAKEVQWVMQMERKKIMLELKETQLEHSRSISPREPIAVSHLDRYVSPHLRRVADKQENLSHFHNTTDRNVSTRSQRGDRRSKYSPHPEKTLAHDLTSSRNNAQEGVPGSATPQQMQKRPSGFRKNSRT